MPRADPMIQGRNPTNFRQKEPDSVALYRRFQNEQALSNLDAPPTECNCFLTSLSHLIVMDSDDDGK